MIYYLPDTIFINIMSLTPYNKKRKCIDLYLKSGIIDLYNKDPSTYKPSKLAKMYDLAAFTISTIVYSKSQQKIREVNNSSNHDMGCVKKLRFGSFEEIEKYLIMWFSDCNKNHPQ